MRAIYLSLPSTSWLSHWKCTPWSINPPMFVHVSLSFCGSHRAVGDSRGLFGSALHAGARAPPRVDVMRAMLKPGRPGRRQCWMVAYKLWLFLEQAAGAHLGVRTSKSGEEQQLGVVQCLYACGKSTFSPMNCISICWWIIIIYCILLAQDLYLYVLEPCAVCNMCNCPWPWTGLMDPGQEQAGTGRPS